MPESDKRVTPPLPYLNAEFLKSQEARLIRILSEYIEPATRLRREATESFGASMRFCRVWAHSPSGLAQMVQRKAWTLFRDS